jgi:hypothetical protein
MPSRRHLTTGEMAFLYCYVPEDRPVTVMTLVRWPACAGWVEIASAWRA